MPGIGDAGEEKVPVACLTLAKGLKIAPRIIWMAIAYTLAQSSMAPSIQLAGDNYSPKQHDARANHPIDFDHWKRRTEKKKPFVKEIDGRAVEFIARQTMLSH